MKEQALAPAPLTAPAPGGAHRGSIEHARSDRIGYLDGWRGLAILLVLQGHFMAIPSFQSDRLGVDIFFSLSGMLMSRILFVQRMPLGTFYKRRASRILPAFYLFVATVFGGAAWLGVGHSWGELISTLLFLRTYLPAVPDIWSSGLPIGHLWSLNVEEHSYILLSLLTLIAFLRGREIWVLTGTGIAAMALYYVYSIWPAMRDSSFEIRTEIAASFIFISAAYFLVRDRVAHWVRPWMPIAALALACVAYLPGVKWWTGAWIAPPALAFAVNHLDRVPRLIRTLLAAAPLRLLGIWSYSIYLWHLPFVASRAVLPVGIPVLGTLLVGLASFYLWENPWRTWLNSR